MTKEYFIVATQEFVAKEIIEARNKNISFPKVWTANVESYLGLEPVYPKDPPTVSDLQFAVRDGFERDESNKWVYKWVVKDRFDTYTKEDGTVVTKEEQETEYLSRPAVAKAQEIRKQRNEELKNSDWTQMSDAPLTAEQKTAWQVYRQSLRDVTAQAGFPYDVAWPSQPE